MKTDVHGKNREEARRERLETKLRTEIPDEALSDAPSLNELEHRKKLYKAVHNGTSTCRCSDKHETFKEELLLAEDEIDPEILRDVKLK